MSASHTGKYESGDPWSHTGRVSSRASGDRNRPLSERDFRMWLTEHRAELWERRVSGEVGRRIGPTGAAGTIWISLSGPLAHGRVVRHGDGSSDWSAYRAVDGVALVDEQRPAVTEADLFRLVDALVSARPQP